VATNARFVRWSDGSLQLQVGSETLDCSLVDLSGQHSHLFTRQPPPASLLAAFCPLRQRLTLRPSSLDSRSHKLLAHSTAQRYRTEVRLKKTVTVTDPEAEKAAREKEERANAKAAEVLARKRAALSEKYAAAGGLSKGFLEDEEGEAAGGEKRKRASKKREKVSLDEESDGDSGGSWSEGEDRRGKRKAKGGDSDED
jgi:RNA polymerase-associated protein LEO1